MAKIIKTLSTEDHVNYGGQFLTPNQSFILDKNSLIRAQDSAKLIEHLMASPALASISTEADPTELTGQDGVDLLMTSDI